MKDRVKDIAVNIFKAEPVESTEHHGGFRLLITGKLVKKVSR